MQILELSTAGYRVPAREHFLDTDGYRVPARKKFWVPMGTGYRPEKNWVPMGTENRKNFHLRRLLC